MPEAEVPEEAKNPFERRVAITIAIIAVLLAINENHNDNAKTDAILQSIEASQKTTEAANQWAYYQAKSLKGHAYEMQRDQLPLVAEAPGMAERRGQLVAEYGRKVEKYEKEKAEIQRKAQELGAVSDHHRLEAKQLIDVNSRCDSAALLLQIAVILCSVAILVHLAPFWYIGVVLALVGAGISASSYLMPEGHGQGAPTEEPSAMPAPSAQPAPAAHGTPSPAHAP